MSIVPEKLYSPSKIKKNSKLFQIEVHERCLKNFSNANTFHLKNSNAKVFKMHLNANAFAFAPISGKCMV